MILKTLISTIASTSCAQSSFLSFPTWYEYLPSNGTNGACSPQLTSLSDIWLILAAVIEILLRIATILTVMYVIYGGIQYVMSQGTPDKVTKSKNTIMNGFVGLIIAISATVVVNYLASSIK